MCMCVFVHIPLCPPVPSAWVCMHCACKYLCLWSFLYPNPFFNVSMMWVYLCACCHICECVFLPLYAPIPFLYKYASVYGPIISLNHFPCVHLNVGLHGSMWITWYLEIPFPIYEYVCTCTQVCLYHLVCSNSFVHLCKCLCMHVSMPLVIPMCSSVPVWGNVSPGVYQFLYASVHMCVGMYANMPTYLVYPNPFVKVQIAVVCCEGTCRFSLYQWNNNKEMLVTVSHLIY